jgi:hypothetical protein
MPSFPATLAIGLTGLALALAGCTGEPESGGPETEPPPSTVQTTDEHGHAHPSEGPHHGELIELGNEEYHGELVHGHENGEVTIYILDGTARQQVPIDATQLTVNAVLDSEPVQFSLAAEPDEGDPEGKSSRFVSRDEKLSSVLDEETAEPRLVVTINGKAYRGAITHDHADHEHHDH